MFFWDLIWALLIGFVLVAILSWIFNVRGPWESVFLFFLIVFLAAWAGGVWLRPIGPAYQDFYWLPFLIVGLVVALILAAAVRPSPPVPPKVEPPPEQPVATTPGEKAAVITAGVLSVFFWIALVALLVAVILGYLFPG